MTKKIILLLAIAGPFITYFFYIRIARLSKKKYPIRVLSLISVILIAVSLGSLRLYDNYPPDLKKPNISLKPFDVLVIQLDSLQRNNIPYNDAGIEQVWNFAHPTNKKITGPLEKFKKMIYSENYKILINHESNEINVLSENATISIYKVYILSNDKKKYSYIWQVEKVQEKGGLMNCWMTTNVSSPKYLGKVI